MPILEVKKLTKTFDEKSLTTVNEVSFHLNKGERFSVIGPSGTGKSTLVKMIAGLISPKSGEVFLDGKLLLNENFYDESLAKKMAYVPQELSLDEDKTIFDNIKTKVAHESEDSIHVKVRDMIEVFGLQYKDFKKPSELSTGQKQRAHMACALVNHPEILVLDEPFSNLDKSLREELKAELFEICEEREITLLMVTHDLEDAFSESDRIMVLADGVVKQIAPPQNIYRRPANSYVARFTGAVNLIAGPITRSSGILSTKNAFGEFSFNEKDYPHITGKFAYLVVRPHMCDVKNEGKFSGIIRRKKFYGAYFDLWLDCLDQKRFIVRVPAHSKLKEGQKIHFDLHVEELFLLSI
ncbi:TOBE domain protein [Bacteriovorax sp. BSW11_IV]|uniref:ABC transporter ATP-binding protein n=1 Tax=Bacteriovorax sp. BSW11_IV TaxID=1353529 RepID=UPI00038A0207|nr:ABC transporter ATP-binding protein [Bacteriovorax sp. BSW11_IV]EQC49178.1 TOBE domain protein [Bacteriovorax sp. BSW11_IV]